jgi:hypothetical protein
MTEEYDEYVEEDEESGWDVCSNSGLPMDKCECLDCFPWIHRFKWMCAGCDTIDDVIETLEGQAQYFKDLRDKGYTVDGEIPDDYMHIVPPERAGHYWARCKACGGYYEAPHGNAERVCEECQR